MERSLQVGGRGDLVSCSQVMGGIYRSSLLVCSNEGVAPIRRGERGAELRGTARFMTCRLRLSF